jgi:hypothetical protein
MTTPIPFDRIIEIRDRDALRLVGRMLESQITVMEAQLNQLRQVQQGVEERIQSLE